MKTSCQLVTVAKRDDNSDKNFTKSFYVHISQWKTVSFARKARAFPFLCLSQNFSFFSTTWNELLLNCVNINLQNKWNSFRNTWHKLCSILCRHYPLRSYWPNLQNTIGSTALLYSPECGKNLTKHSQGIENYIQEPCTTWSRRCPSRIYLVA